MRGHTYEAKTTSLPQGDIDADPTGSLMRKDPSFPKVGLSFADTKPFAFSSSIMMAMMAFAVLVDQDTRNDEDI